MTAGQVKAIETRYAGCRFRSRLEARWAVFFDAMGVEWQYEPQGYIVGYGEKPYLPDFFIKQKYGRNFWVEVKGDASLFDRSLIDDCVDWGMGLPGMACRNGLWGNEEAWLVLLSDIPRTPSWFPVAVHYKGSALSPGHFSGDFGNFICLESSGGRNCNSANGGNSCLNDPEIKEIFDLGTSTLSMRPACGSHSPHDLKVQDALTKSRSARFEHGESG